MAPSPRLLRIGKLVGYLIGLALVAWVARTAAEGVSFAHLHPVDLVIAVAIACLYWLSMGRGWAALTGERSVPAMATWSRSQILRYIPGGIWAPAARGATVSGRKRDKLATVVVEDSAQLAVAAAIGGVALAGGGASPWWALFAGAAIGPVAVVEWGPRLLRATRRAAAPDLPTRRVATACGWYAVAFSSFAVASLFAQAAMGPGPGAVEVAGAALIAWCVGLIVIFAPSGLGPREATYVALLAGLAPSAQVAAGALVARLCLVLAEVAVLLAIGHRKGVAIARSPRPGDAGQPEGAAGSARPGTVDSGGPGSAMSPTRP